MQRLIEWHAVDGWILFKIYMIAEGKLYAEVAVQL